MQASRPTDAERATSNAHEESPLELSARERVVIEKSAAGFTSGEIAAALGISPKTVDTYRARGMKKLHFTHRSELVRHAISEGWL